jgi:hypothetical protein
MRHYRDVPDAIARESQLKKWSRIKKVQLINRLNRVGKVSALTFCKTDKSRDLVRLLPVRSAFGLPAYVTASRAAPFSTVLRSARNDRMRDLNGNAYCAAQKPGEDDIPDLHT